MKVTATKRTFTATISPYAGNLTIIEFVSAVKVLQMKSTEKNEEDAANASRSHHRRGQSELKAEKLLRRKDRSLFEKWVETFGANMRPQKMFWKMDKLGSSETGQITLDDFIEYTKLICADPTEAVTTLVQNQGALGHSSVKSTQCKYGIRYLRDYFPTHFVVTVMLLSPCAAFSLF